MTRKSKDPAGACPRCRKEIPLVPDSQGDLVLQEHHVVAMTRSHGMADVAVCPGSRGAAASLDDSEDWAWVTPNPQWIRDDTLRAPIRLTDAMSNATTAMRAFSATVSSQVPPLDDAAPCPAHVGGCRCVKAPCDGAHRCTCGHSWAAREFAG